MIERGLFTIKFPGLLILLSGCFSFGALAFPGHSCPRRILDSKSSTRHTESSVTTLYARNQMGRRDLMSSLPFLTTAVSLGIVDFAGSRTNAAEFTPGGTLVDRQVGVLVGNAEASPSRKVDNSNVLFDKDHYFKFGVAAPWIEPDSVEFPKTMPFVPSQQRYDALKKYGDRIIRGQEYIIGLKSAIEAGGDLSQTIKDPSEPEYMLRPMGLFANSMLATENTGEKNELFLARWYINEIYLRINDIRNASTKEEALKAYSMLPRAFNSYYSMINRVVTPKVGEKFKYL